MKIVMKTKLMIVLLLQAMEVLADTEVYVGKLCFRCYDETMTAELVANWFCENPVDIIVPQTVEADGKVYTVTAIGDAPFMIPIESVQLPPTIKRIGAKAFYSSNIEEIVLPDSIETIGERAFGSFLSSLRKVVFPEKVKNLKIGASAFLGCPIEELTLPEGLTELGYYSFGHAHIRTLTIPSSVKSIPDYCFNECESLESVSLPEGIEYIGTCAFGNTNLQSFVIPSTVKKMGVAPFSASPIKEITIPATITHWPNQFLLGTDIETINIPEGVVEIGDECFRFCSNLKSITIPKSVKIVGEAIVDACNALTTLTIPSSLEVIKGDPQIPENTQLIVTGNDNKVRMENGMLINDRGEEGCWLVSVPDDAVIDGKFTIPEGVNALGNSSLLYKPIDDLVNMEAIEYLGSSALSGTNITSIDMPQLKELGNNAFSLCSSLQQVTLPEGLKEIPERCFYGCSALESVNLPTTIESIGSWAFYDAAIKQINLPEGLKEIGNGAFSSCDIEHLDVPSSCTTFHLNSSRVKTVTLPEGLTTIPSFAFNGCSSLESINLPSTLKIIEEQAFVGCKNLQEITLPEGLDTLAYGAFALSGLTSIVIPESVTEMGASVFQSCPLTYCEIKSPLREIPDGMFYKCKQLQQVVMPNTVERFGMNSFWCNFALNDIYFPSSLKELGYAAMAGCGLDHLKFPSAVEQIGEYCFGSANCSTVDLSLTQLKELPGNAFNECPNLKSIILPASVEVITDNFYLCPDIERVECLSAVPPVVEGETFDEEVFTKATLVVPTGSEAAYRNAEVWKKFANISTTTGINSTVIAPQDDERIYDLRGVEMKNVKGIVIKNGIKVFKK